VEFDDWFVQLEGGSFKLFPQSGNVELQISKMISRLIVDKYDPDKMSLHFTESREFSLRVEHLLKNR
jgi:hypothetical protein